MRGKVKNRYSHKLYPTLEKCTMKQRTPSQGIVQRDFPIFERMKFKSFTRDMVPKSAQNTHLTAEPIPKQRAVFGSRPLIASKPGSPPERYCLNNITSQPWSDGTCTRTTPDSAYFCLVKLFSYKMTRHSMVWG